jgi:hypothetical protein
LSAELSFGNGSVGRCVYERNTIWIVVRVGGGGVEEVREYRTFWEYGEGVGRGVDWHGEVVLYRRGGRYFMGGSCIR